ncbi:MAG: thiamine diphosphokinase [Clostridia bacterium]
MVNSKKCMIIGASPVKNDSVFKEFNPKEYFVICADGGYATAKEYGIEPDYTVGDFDSLGAKPDLPAQKYRVLPIEKDVTDTMFAAMLGIKKGCRDFVLIGCLKGDREDHSFANYNVLVYLAKKGAFPVIADDTTKVFVLINSRIKITDQKDSIVSVFPFGTNTCLVSYKGLKYPLNYGQLTVGDELMGVSNKVVSDDAEVYVHAGSALIMLYTKNEQAPQIKRTQKRTTTRKSSF